MHLPTMQKMDPKKEEMTKKWKAYSTPGEDGI